MSVSGALREALVDGYHHSWRLVVLNTALAAAALGVLVAASYAQPALLLLLLVGPLAAALQHCAVVLVRTDELRLRDALDGLRRHWRRGAELAAVAAVTFGLGIYALVFYARADPVTWPLAALVVYLLALFAALQLLVWPLAVAYPERPLRAVALESLMTAARRPFALPGLALALLVVNSLGAVAILPVLTMTAAYTALAAAHFALPSRPTPEA
jgi:hypothetical protein